MDATAEKTLVASCRNGDRAAYASLVKVHSGRVFAICLGMLGNRHDAEDMAQQTQAIVREPRGRRRRDEEAYEAT